MPSATPTFTTALVTGAGSGIGQRVAEQLAMRGARVIALDLSVGAESRKLITSAGGGREPIVIEADVRDGETVTAKVAEAVAELGAPLGIAFNAAGVQDAAPFGELDEERFRRVIDINLVGSRNVAAAAIVHMRSGSRLVLVGSMASLVANYSYAAYCASKFGVLGLGEVLRIEMAPRGIGVSVVCPPEVETPMVDEERRTMSETARELKSMAGRLELDPAVREIMAGIDAGRFLIVVSPSAKALAQVARHGPRRMTHAITDRVVRRTLPS